MKFSIIMPAFNAAVFIDEAIQSIVNQSYADWELIIINDGSTDNTWEKIQAWQETDSRITGLSQEKSGRPSVARNKGIKLAKGDYICFLDADDSYTVERLQLFKDFFEQNGDVQICFSDLKTATESGDVIKASYLGDRNFMPLVSDCIFARQEGDMVVLNTTFYNFMCCVMTSIYTITVVIKTELLKEVGSFNENFVVGEDVDLWFRLAQQRSVGFINKPLACYRMNLKSITRENERYLIGTYMTHFSNLERANTVLSKEEYKIYLSKISQMAEHLAYFYRQNRNKKQSLEYYFKAIKLNPSPKALFNLVKALVLTH